MFVVSPLFIHKEGIKGSLKLHNLTPPSPLFIRKRGGNGIAGQVLEVPFMGLEPDLICEIKHIKLKEY
jgi:hypothetical protein